MACFSPDKPGERKYGGELAGTLESQARLEPRRLTLEQEYSPQYQTLALQNLGLTLGGTGDVSGYLDLIRQQNRLLRTADIQDVTALGGPAVSALNQANPDRAQLLAELNRQALGDLGLGQQLSPEQQRLMQQASRAAYSARGLAGTQPAIGDEIFQQYQLGQQLQNQRRGFAGNVAGYNQAGFIDPYQLVLSRPSNAIAQAQGLRYDQPIFNPESAYAGNIYNANQQMEAQFADPSLIQKIGMVGGTLAQGSKGWGAY